MPDEEKPSARTIPERPSSALPNPVEMSRIMTDMPDGDHRAELQAMLVLLAAQLTEVVHADGDDGGASVDKEPLATVVTDLPPPAVKAISRVVSAAQQEEEEDSDEDMEEVI